MGASKQLYTQIQEEMLSKVTAVQANGTYEGQYGLKYSFEYKMEDGTILNANHNTESPLPIGTEVEYEVKGDNSYGPYGSVRKYNPQYSNSQNKPKPSNGYSKPSGGGSKSDVDWEFKDKKIVRQSSLKIALDYLHQKGFEGQTKAEQIRELCDIAEMITDYVVTKSEPVVKGYREHPSDPDPLPQTPTGGLQEADLAREQATAHLTSDLPF